MTWEEFYKNYDNWDREELNINFREVTDFKDASPQDFKHLLLFKLLDEKSLYHLENYVRSGEVKLTDDTIIDIVDNYDYDPEEAIFDDVDLLYDLSLEELRELAKDQNLLNDDDYFDEESIREEMEADREEEELHQTFQDMEEFLIHGYIEDIEAEQPSYPKFSIGDRVKIIHAGEEGTIVDFKEGLPLVIMDSGFKTTFEEDELDIIW